MRVLRENAPRTFRFRLGVFFLLINIPFGLAGVALAGWMIARTGHVRFWSLVGGGIYASSWLLFGAGVLLAGPDGKAYVKNIWRSLFRRKIQAGSSDKHH